jgi:predicted dehydrogenase
MTAPVRPSVMGAGLIGKRHIEHILARPEAVLSSIVDPMPAARELAVLLNVDWFPSFQDLLSENRPDGVVVATSNQVHRQFAFASRLAALLLIMAIG